MCDLGAAARHPRIRSTCPLGSSISKFTLLRIERHQHPNALRDDVLVQRRGIGDEECPQLSIAQRNHRPMVALMVDVDHFK